MEREHRGIRKKVVAGAAVAIAIPAAVGVAKKILSDADQGEPQQERRGGSRGKDGGRASSGGQTKTKAQLYATAKRLNVEGRSKMTKQQLERAIARAGGG